MIDLHKRVFSMLGQRNNLKSDIVKHFMQEGFKTSTVYDIIKCYEMSFNIFGYEKA